MVAESDTEDPFLVVYVSEQVPVVGNGVPVKVHPVVPYSDA